jgi:DNA-binding NarL/FixJ family response regulator
LKIFIADDSAAVRERLTEMLSELKDLEVVGQAEDGLHAIDSIRELKADAVILDIHMPNGSDIDVLQNIKMEQPTPIVIMLTNYAYPQYRKRCMDAGADFFFDKSTQFDEMMKVLAALM